MDKELEDKIDELGKYFGGRLVRFAYYLSMDHTIKESCQLVDRHDHWFEQGLTKEQRELTKEVANLLIVDRVKNAHVNTSMLMANSAVEAGEKILQVMRHPNPKYSLPAAREVLKTVGVNPDNIRINVDGQLEVDLQKVLEKRLDKVYGETEPGEADNGSTEAESTEEDAE